MVVVVICGCIIDIGDIVVVVYVMVDVFAVVVVGCGVGDGVAGGMVCVECADDHSVSGIGGCNVGGVAVGDDVSDAYAEVDACGYVAVVLSFV